MSTNWIPIADAKPEDGQWCLTLEGCSGMKRSAEKLQKDADAVERAICESSMYSMGAGDALANQPDWQSACKNEARNCSRFQAEVCRLRAALDHIADMPYWHGVKMIKIAREALGTDER